MGARFGLSIFPIVPYDPLGWSLPPFDMATNKALALGSRIETRDYVDIVELSRLYPLEAIVWAACGKAAGFNPMLRFSSRGEDEARFPLVRFDIGGVVFPLLKALGQKLAMEIDRLLPPVGNKNVNVLYGPDRGQSLVAGTMCY